MPNEKSNTSTAVSTAAGVGDAADPASIASAPLTPMARGGLIITRYCSVCRFRTKFSTKSQQTDLFSIAHRYCLTCGHSGSAPLGL